MKKALTAVVLAICFTLVAAFALADLEIRFLSAGQGDAILIGCDGEYAMIDAGPVAYSNHLYSLIRKELKISEINFILLTHPHDDHAGGIPAVLNSVPVGEIISPVLDWDSAVFSDIKRYASRQGTPIEGAAEGDRLELGSATLDIIHSWPDAWVENDMSLVVRLQYNGFSAIFTGDAEAMAEYMILDSNRELRSDLIKIGHHGSSSSSTKEFLQAVQPKYAVISCGTGNDYGHPHQEVLDRLKSLRTETYRTDLQGTVVFHIDERGNISIRTDREAGPLDDIFTAPVIISDINRAMSPDSDYVVNVKSGKFHLPGCDSVKDIYIQNRKEYTGTREDLIRMGYSPCHRCNP